MCEVVDRTIRKLESVKQYVSSDGDSSTKDLPSALTKEQQHLCNLFMHVGDNVLSDVRARKYGILEAFTGSERRDIEAAIWAGKCEINDIPNTLAHSVITRPTSWSERLFFLPPINVFED